MRFLPNHLKHHRKGTPSVGSARAANGLKLRGVVTRVSRPEASDARPKGYSEQAAPGVTCDVHVIDRGYRSILKNVPIMVSSAGVNDHEVWVPTATTQSLAASSPLMESADSSDGASNATKSHEMNGDYVVIEFLANDLNQPIITGQLPHPQNSRRPVASSPTLFKYSRHVRGVLFGVTEDGDVLVDLSAPSDGTLNAVGGETVNLSGGNLTLTLQSGALVSFVASGVSSPERVMHGNTFLTQLSNSLTEISALLSGLGLVPTYTTGTFLPSITTSLVGSGGAPFLSEHVEAD